MHKGRAVVIASDVRVVETHGGIRHDERREVRRQAGVGLQQATQGLAVGELGDTGQSAILLGQGVDTEDVRMLEDERASGLATQGRLQLGVLHDILRCPDEHHGTGRRAVLQGESEEGT